MPRDLPSDLTHPTIAESLKHHSISLSEWKKLPKSQDYVALAMGGFIFRLSPSSSTSSTPLGTPQLLLIHRASTDSYPNLWEPPGGSVDAEDETILHGLVREVWEETGLRVKSVDRQIWDADGSGKREVDFPDKRGRLWCKGNFLVSVWSEEELRQKNGKTKAGEEVNGVKEGGTVEVDYAVVLDDKEHQDWGWFTKEEMEELPFISEQGREIVRNAFVAFGEGLKQ